MSKAPENITAKLRSIPLAAILQKQSQAEPKQTDFMTDKMKELLTRQIGREAFSSYLYHGVAGYFDAAGLEGFKKYFQKAAVEELQHMHKIHNFMLIAGISPELPAQEAAPGDYASPKAALQASLDHEISVTADWVKITAQARTDENGPVESMGQWFVTEQMEEEDKLVKLIQRLSYGGDGAVLILDGQLLEELED